MTRDAAPALGSAPGRPAVQDGEGVLEEEPLARASVETSATPAAFGGRGRIASRAALVLAFALASDVRAEAAPRVKVRGTTTLSALAFPSSPREQVVRGSLVDDAGRAVPGRLVRIAPPAGSTALLTRCADGGTAEPLGGGVGVRTGSDGTFCVRLVAREGVLGPVRLRLSHEGDAWLDGAAVEHLVDPTAQTLALRFVLDASPARVSLDAPTAVVRIVAEAPRAGGDPPSLGGVEGVQVSLTDERGERLADLRTGPGGLAVADVPTARLGPPGLGELRARVADGTSATAAPISAPVERTAKVTLEVGAPHAPVVRGDVAVLEIAARALGAPAARGSVAATLPDGTIAAAATLADGHARLEIAADVAPLDDDTLALSVAFVPDGPGLVADAAVGLSVPVREPSPARHAPWIAAAAFVALFFVVGRRRPRAVPAAAAPARAPVVARVEVTAAAPGADPDELRGRVTDAHEGTPVAGAIARLEHVGFDGVKVLAETRADAQGAFVLRRPRAPGRDDGHGTELVCEAPLHRAHRHPAPRGGVAAVALVSRRRHLLDALVRWAQGRWHAARGPEPTPATIRARAAESAPEAAPWASAVERAAFGPAPVDAASEAAVEALAARADAPRDDAGSTRG